MNILFKSFERTLESQCVVGLIGLVMFECSICGLLSLNAISCPACGKPKFGWIYQLRIQRQTILPKEIPGLDEAAESWHEIEGDDAHGDESK